MYETSPVLAPDPTAPPAGDTPIVRLEGACKSYDTPAGPFPALVDVSLELAAGGFIGVVGKSGSGKSTLLHLVAGIDRPTGGTVEVAGVRVDRLPERALARWRGRHAGVVFQFFQLLPTLTVVENVMLPMDLCAAWPRRERLPRALALLERMGIADQAAKLPAALSGGQQQRAAIARALANDPPLLCADEPTGNLDSRTAEDVLGLFAGLAAAGKTVLMVTHERDAGRYLDRVLTIVDGRLAGEADRG